MTASEAEDKIAAEVKRLKALLDEDAVDRTADHLSAETDASVRKAIHLTAGTCALVAIQPLPFADIFVLAPIQATLACRIARLRGQEVSMAQARRMLRELIGVIGLGYTAQQAAIGLYKLGLPGFGGFVTIPLVYGLTYGIGRVIDFYYRALASGTPFSRKEAVRVFRSGRKEGRRASR